MFFVNKTISMV